MITVEELAEMNFGLEIGEKYRITFNKRTKNKSTIREGIYLGEGGVDKDFLIFKSIGNNIRECFLKIDVFSGEYRLKHIEIGGYYEQNSRSKAYI